jgi:hypothetical protein
MRNRGNIRTSKARILPNPRFSFIDMLSFLSAIRATGYARQTAFVPMTSTGLF